MTERAMNSEPPGALGIEGEQAVEVTRDFAESLRLEGSFTDRVLDLAQAIVLVLDAEGRIAFFNRFLAELTGYELDEVRGRDWFSTFIRRPDRGELRMVFRATKQAGGTSGIRNLIVTRSGEERLVEWRNCALEGRDGRVLGVLAVGQDVTHHVEKEELQRIRRDEALLRSVTASVPGAVFQLLRRADGEFELLFLSDGARDLFGIDPRAAVARLELVRASIHPEDQVEYFRALEHSAASGESFRFEHRLAGDGAQRWVLTTAQPDPRPDGSTIWNGLVTDITPQKEAQEARRRAEERWRSLLETAPDAMVLVGENGRIQLVNAQAERLFGYQRDELMGESVEILIPEELREAHRGHRAEFRTRPRARTMGSQLELVGQRKDGSQIPVEVSLSPVPTPTGLIVSAAIRDASERRRSETRLRRAQAAAERSSASKSRFLAIASHDLRQPLQAAHLYLGVLTSELGDERPRSLEKLRTCLDALGTLLSKLFDISKLESGRVIVAPEAFDVGPLLERLADEARSVAQAKGLELRLVPTTTRITSDPHLLEQILQNLLSNAVRYTDRGRILLGCRRQGDRLCIQVWDQGRGIGEEDLERIFEEFYRVEEGDARDGLGLGLAIVSRLASLLDHPVGVVSRLGVGSRFEVSVPVCSGDDGEVGVADEVGDESPTGVIVVVESDPHVLDAMRLSLEVAGHRVVAGSSADAITASLRRERLVPDVVISELRLGPDEGGIEAVKRLRAEFGAGVTGILLTGDTSPAQVARATGEGLELLYKPVAPAELDELLTQHLRRRR